MDDILAACSKQKLNYFETQNKTNNQIFVSEESWKIYMRKTPNRVFSIGLLSAAESASPITLRVSTGSITPSSQIRAVEKYGDPSSSNLKKFQDVINI